MHDFPNLDYERLKWRWATKQPTEGLNRPDIYLGVLRACFRAEGHRKSSTLLFQELRRAESLLQPIPPNLHLARDRERNILRNSGQYWTGLGTLAGARGVISLTDLGRAYASGQMDYLTFGSYIANTHTLPSPVYTQSDSSYWLQNIEPLRPLAFILDVLSALEDEGFDHAYLTSEELGVVIQPLSVVTRDLGAHVRALLEYRTDKTTVMGWPDMLTGSNDPRVMDEFMLFLAYHGFLTTAEDDETKYYKIVEVDELDAEEVRAVIGDRELLPEEDFARKVVWRAAKHRPGQGAFRRAVLRSAENTCLMTGSKIDRTLQAAHIRPVEFDGSDSVGNGLCLRADIHLLYDSGHIKIDNLGSVLISDEVRNDPTYESLPDRIEIPAYVDAGNLNWRTNFL